MGQVGIPAPGRSLRLIEADTPMGQGPGGAAQPPTNPQQAVVAQADAATDHVEAHEAGARCRAVQVGFGGVEPQAQLAQLHH
jgi:hypothetical protein